MHPNSFKLMAEFFARFVSSLPPGRILDVGSANVNGTYRSLVPAGWSYTGLDLTPGKSVDVIAPQPPWPFQDGYFPVAISGQCLEHTRRPWEIAAEIGRVLAPEGYCCIIAPWRWDVHRHPVDCWRILPDGMEVLLRLAGCEVLEAKIDRDDTVGIGRRREPSSLDYLD